MIYKNNLQLYAKCGNMVINVMNYFQSWMSNSKSIHNYIIIYN